MLVPIDVSAASAKPACTRTNTVPANPEPWSGSWEALPQGPVDPRGLASVAWTGDELIVWGGEAGNEQARSADGAALDVATGTWRMVAPAGLTPRSEHAAVWTGTSMIVLGGAGVYPSRPDDAAAYDPNVDRWRPLPPSPIGGTEFPAAAWTGTEVLVWGGTRGGGVAPEARGAAYRPATNRWRRIPNPPIPGRRQAASAWTGCELVVFGGDPARFPIDGNTGAVYTPRTRTWRALPTPPFGTDLLYSTLRYPQLVWTGREVILWGYLRTADGGIAPAAAYNPASDQWRRLPDPPLDFADPWEGSGGHQAVWAGDAMIATTGNLDVHGTRTLRLDPDTGEWSELPSPPDGENYFGTLIWTGDALIDWRWAGAAYILKASAP